MQRVIRTAHRAQDRLTGLRTRGERRDDRVCPACEIQTRERALTAEDPCEQRLVMLACGIVVPVAERTRQIGFGEPFFEKGADHAHANARALREITRLKRGCGTARGARDVLAALRTFEDGLDQRVSSRATSRD